MIYKNHKVKSKSQFLIFNVLCQKCKLRSNDKNTYLDLWCFCKIIVTSNTRSYTLDSYTFQ